MQGQRIHGYVVMTDIYLPGHWEVFYNNGAILVAPTIHEAHQLVVNERELNEPNDWAPNTYRIMDLETGKLYRLLDDESDYEEDLCA